MNKWARSIQTLYRAWERTGEQPQPLRDRPTLELEDQYYLAAYQVIARERPQAFGGVPGITLASIERYLRFWPDDDPTMFAEIMLCIDDEWRGPEIEKQRQERAKK